MENFEEKAKGIGRRSQVLTSNEMLRNLKINTSIREGAARTGWHDRKLSDMETQIYNDTKYVKFLDEGTGIYGPRGQEITPKKGKFLRFQWDKAPSTIKPGKGGFYFFRSVKGIKPFHIIKKSVATTKPRIPQFIQRAIREARS